MDFPTLLIESQARERALLVELNAAKIGLVQAEGATREAVAEKEAANRENSLKRLSLRVTGCDPPGRVTEGRE